MKTIIAGSRVLTRPDEERMVNAIINTCPWVDEITEIVSGHAMGADLLGELWAEANMVPGKLFPANWKLYGKQAGILRNIEMANYADALIYIQVNGSRGTAHMISEMKKRKKPTWGASIDLSDWQPA